MASLNRVQVIGNLGRDPETTFTPSGRQVTRFSVASNRKWTSSDGEKKEATDWFNVEAWGGLAKVVAEFQKKGRLVYVEGRLQTDRYDDANGVPQQRTKIVASNVQFLDRNGEHTEELELEPADADGIPF